MQFLREGRMLKTQTCLFSRPSSDPRLITARDERAPATDRLCQTRPTAQQHLSSILPSHIPTTDASVQGHTTPTETSVDNCPNPSTFSSFYVLDIQGEFPQASSDSR